MRLGFLISLLNGADHIAGLLTQICDYGEVVIIEFADSFRDTSESNLGHSIDESFKIASSYDNVNFIRMGKVSTPAEALNKGVHILNSVNYIVKLIQGDIFIKFDKFIESIGQHEFVTTRRHFLLDDFHHSFLGKQDIIGFRNYEGICFRPRSNELFLNGNLASKSMNFFNDSEMLVNLQFITSTSKRNKLLLYRERLNKFYDNGIIAARRVKWGDFSQPKAFYRQNLFEDIQHPWKDQDKNFLKTIILFPSIFPSEWNKNKKLEEKISSRVWGLNCAEFKRRFESEGWEFFEKPEGLFDLVVAIGTAPLTKIWRVLKEEGRVVLLDLKRKVKDERFRVLFFEESKMKYSYTLEKL